MPLEILAETTTCPFELQFSPWNCRFIPKVLLTLLVTSVRTLKPCLSLEPLQCLDIWLPFQPCLLVCENVQNPFPGDLLLVLCPSIIFHGNRHKEFIKHFISVFIFSLIFSLFYSSHIPSIFLIPNDIYNYSHSEMIRSTNSLEAGKQCSLYIPNWVINKNSYKNKIWSGLRKN